MSRRHFLQQTSALGAASLFGISSESRAEPPPETRKIRLVQTPAICVSPLYIAEEFLRAEGFTEIEYIKEWTRYPSAALEEGRADFTQDTAPSLLPLLDNGSPLAVIAGIHAGCYELFANDSVRSIRDLKGKTIAIAARGSPDHMLLTSMLAYVGINPNSGVNWRMGSTTSDAMDLFATGKADAIMAFAPEPHELRERKVGHVIVNTAVDKPWSQYFCCLMVAQREFVARNPVATKRALRAFLKATDVCASDPRRAANALRAKGFEWPLDLSQQVIKELPFRRWREANPEDTLRFHALRFHEVGLIKTTPQKLIAQSTDWRFLNELKKELKA